MENRKFLKFIILVGIFSMSPFFVSAYSAETTHPALTHEVVTFFNDHYKDFSLNKEERQLVIQGSIDEDTPVTRVLKHFYDPVYNRGLKGVNLTAKEWAKSGDFGNDLYTLVAGGVVSLISRSDDLWENAIYQYVWDDKKEGLKLLGHVLHLIEDMTAPDHTRNDAHLTINDTLESIIHEKSPYESWTAQFDIKSIDVVSKLKNKNPIILGSIEEYFDEVAMYSNNNFFSKDTIFSEEYNLPNIDFYKEEKLSTGLFVSFGYRENNQFLYKIVRKDAQFNWSNIFRETKADKFFITDDDNLIFTDYWNLLSQQAVLNGAGIVKLFFDEVEKERETRELYEKNRSWLDKLIDKTKKKLYNIAGVLYGTSVSYDEVERLNGIEEGPQLAAVIQTLEVQKEDVTEVNQEPTPEVSEENLLREDANLEEELYIEDSLITEDGTEGEESQINLTDDLGSLYHGGENAYQPGFGGGGGIKNEVTEVVPPSESVDPTAEEDTTPPEAPIILSPITITMNLGSTTPSFVYSLSTTTSVSFIGTAEASSTVSALYDYQGVRETVATTTNEMNEWGLELLMDQGTTTVYFIAVDEAGNESTTTERVVFIDTNAPDIVLDVHECTDSIALSGCLVATTTLNFSWSSDASDLAFFTIDAGGDISTTTATSTEIIVEDNSILTFSITAHDVYGNVSASVTKEVEIASMPVVINEIAWMGTAGSVADEWIELHNPTSKDISLDGWVLYTEDGAPYINLEGNISAGGYYLIEGTDDDTVSNITADLVSSFYKKGGGVGSRLSDNGESMSLVRVILLESTDLEESATSTARYATTTIDRVARCGGWCAGSNHSKLSMERRNPYVSGTEGGNWGSFVGDLTRYGEDVSGNLIGGTPRAKNSVRYLIGNGGVIVADLTLNKKDSPYYVPRQGFTLPQGVTLTIEPGVVIKVDNVSAPQVVINGILQSLGTEDEPVVITSYFDDEYGGDFNGDGVCDTGNASSTAACPEKGAWTGIVFYGLSVGSELRHTFVRYAGRSFNLSPHSAIEVYNTDVTFDHVTVEYSSRDGIYLENSSSVITDSTVSYSGEWQKRGAGISIQGGAPTITNSLFIYNNIGISGGDAGATITGNIFNNNIGNAISGNTKVTYRDNSGEGNGKSAIVLDTALTEQGVTDHATTTLYKNSLPYLMGMYSPPRIYASTTLAFENGVVIKVVSRHNPRIIIDDGGVLYHDGTDPSSLIFTSVYDDTVGGVTNVSTSTPSAGAWQGIYVSEGGRIDLSGFTIRYAGGDLSDRFDFAAIRLASSATSTLRHGIIEKSYGYGIKASLGSYVNLFDIIFRDHTEERYFGRGSTAVELDNAIFEGDSITFERNDLDVRASNNSTVTCINCHFLPSGTAKTEPAGLLP